MRNDLSLQESMLFSAVLLLLILLLLSLLHGTVMCKLFSLRLRASLEELLLMCSLLLLLKGSFSLGDELYGLVFWPTGGVSSSLVDVVVDADADVVVAEDDAVDVILFIVETGLVEIEMGRDCTLGEGAMTWVIVSSIIPLGGEMFLVCDEISSGF